MSWHCTVLVTFPVAVSQAPQPPTFQSLAHFDASVHDCEVILGPMMATFEADVQYASDTIAFVMPKVELQLEERYPAVVEHGGT